MKKPQLFLLTILLLLIATSCQPSMKEFQPEKESLFKITFLYPSNWVLKKDVSIPEIKPYVYYPPSESIVSENSPISINVFQPPYPQEFLQEWIDSYLGAVGSMLRTDITFEINGYYARRLKVVYPPQNTAESHVQEVIYLLAEDRFYAIDISYPESEASSVMKREFEELIKTIKIMQ
jgi:hypothetical protein